MEQVMNKKLVHMWINVTSCDLMERWLVRWGKTLYMLFRRCIPKCMDADS